MSDLTETDIKEARRIATAAIKYNHMANVTGQSVMRLVDALSDRDARIAELEAGLRLSEKSLVSLYSAIAAGDPEAGERFAAKDPAIQIARALLTPTGTEIKDE